jgi:hypothetical protein
MSVHMKRAFLGANAALAATVRDADGAEISDAQVTVEVDKGG